MIKESKEDRKKRFRAMTSKERKKLIREKMKFLGIEEGSGVPNKIYDNSEVIDLILITNCFKYKNS